MSVRIATSLTLDIASFDAGLAKAEANAKRSSGRVEALSMRPGSGKSARESASAMSALLSAQESSAAKVAATEKAALDERRKVATKAYFGGSADAGGGKPGAMGALGGVLARTFNVGSLFKGLLVGAGIGSVVSLLDKGIELVAEKFERAAAAAKQLADFSERSRVAVQKQQETAMKDPQLMANLKGAERVKRRLLRSAQDELPVGEEAEGENRLRVARLSAELDENSLEQATLKKKMTDERLTKLNAIVDVERQSQEQWQQRQTASLTLEQQLTHAKIAAAQNDERAAKAKPGSLARAQAGLAAEKALTEAARLRGEISVKTNEDWDRAIEEAAKDQEHRAKLIEDKKDAAKTFKKARAELARQKSDSLGFTVDQLSFSPGGRRDTTAAGMEARGISRDEATARRLARSGRSVSLYETGRGRFDADARFFQDRALKARGSMKQLTSDERNPFREAETALKDAGTELKAAALELKNVNIEVTVD